MLIYQCMFASIFLGSTCAYACSVHSEMCIHVRTCTYIMYIHYVHHVHVHEIREMSCWNLHVQVYISQSDISEQSTQLSNWRQRKFRTLCCPAYPSPQSQRSTPPANSARWPTMLIDHTSISTVHYLIFFACPISHLLSICGCVHIFYPVMVTSFKDLKKHKHLFVTIPPILHRVIGPYPMLHVHVHKLTNTLHVFMVYVTTVLLFTWLDLACTLICISCLP